MMFNPGLVAATVLALFLAGCQSPQPRPQARLGQPVTTTGAPLNLGPELEVIPANPRQVITMLPPPAALNPIYTDFLSSLDGYVEDSGRVEAIYPSPAGNVWILRWETTGPPLDGVCRAAAGPDSIPTGWGCGSGSPDEAHALDGISQSSGDDGSQEILVSHTPDAEATVIELADQSSFIVIPGKNPVSFHRWEGPVPVRITIFWDDGTRLSHPLQ